MPKVRQAGRDIYYRVSGSGTPVVLLHSFLCDGDMWQPQLAPLAEKYRVINVDLRGHGDSDMADTPLDLYDLVQDVLAVLDQEQITNAVWAGLSIGGMIALRAALTAPDRVRALILLDTDAGPEKPYKRYKYKAMVLAAKLLGIGPMLPMVTPLMFGRTTRATQPELVTYWRHKFACMSLRSIDNIADALCNRDSLHTRLGTIAHPALVMVGEQDVSLPPPCSETLAAQLPHARYQVIEHAGHLSTLEQPHTVTAAMLEFLALHAAQPSRT